VTVVVLGEAGFIMSCSEHRSSGHSAKVCAALPAHTPWPDSAGGTSCVTARYACSLESQLHCPTCPREPNASRTCRASAG
jgi:hypothetical protein